MGDMQIPKIIHYCWVGGGPKTKLAKRCIASWKKYMPDYEIREWNAENFDLKCNDFVAEAYAARKWAFVSDYVRFWAVYNYGGIYFDSDVELWKPIDGLIAGGAFMPLCHKGSVEPGSCLCAPAGLGIYKEILDGFKGDHFALPEGAFNVKTCPNRVMEVLHRHGFYDADEEIVCAGLRILPEDYFACPGKQGRIRVTDRTVAIHYYSGSWGTPRQRIVRFVRQKLGLRLSWVVSLLMHNPIYIVRRIRSYLKTGK